MDLIHVMLKLEFNKVCKEDKEVESLSIYFVHFQGVKIFRFNTPWFNNGVLECKLARSFDLTHQYVIITLEFYIPLS